MRSPSRLLTSPFISEAHLRTAYHRSMWTLQDSEAAIRVAAETAKRMPKAASAMLERRRKRGMGGTNRVILEGDRLFDLVLLEQIEREEVRQERLGLRLTQQELTKRFVKHPIKIGANRTGFYAAAAMCFGLCDYRGSELQRLYRAVAPESSNKGDRECCRAKKLVHNSIAQRFGRVAVHDSTCPLTGAPRKLRRAAPTPKLLGLMEEGLELYMAGTPTPPHNSRVSRPDGPFTFPAAPGDLPELQRIAVFFNLESYRHLTGFLAMEPFEMRARTIILKDDDATPRVASADPDDTPLDRILDLIDQDAARAHSLRPGSVRVRVDGITRCSLNSSGDTIPMVLEETATFVELVGEAADGEEVVLGTYILTYDGEKRERWDVQLPWASSERISCTFDYGVDDCVGAIFKRSKTFVVVIGAGGSGAMLAKTFNPAYLNPGATVGPYLIAEVLDTKEDVETYRAIDDTVGKHVVIKRWRTGPDPEAVLRHVGTLSYHARRSPQRAPALDFDSFMDEGRVCVAREFVEGSPFDEWMRDESAEPEVVLRQCLALLERVGLAHRRGLIHRDIKPSNVIVDRSGQVKLLDFGVGMNSMKPQCKGLRYSAPELGAGMADVRSDVFSVGVLLYEALTGYHPFAPDGDRRDVPYWNGSPVAPEAINPYLSSSLGEVMLKSIELVPERRFQNVFAFRRALANCANRAGRVALARKRVDRRLTSLFIAGKTNAFETIYAHHRALVRGQLGRFGCGKANLDSLEKRVFADLVCQLRHHVRPDVGISRLSHRAARLQVCAVSKAACIREIDLAVRRESDATRVLLEMSGYAALNRNDRGSVSISRTAEKSTLVRRLIIFGVSIGASMPLIGVWVAGAFGVASLSASVAAELWWASKRRKALDGLRDLRDDVRMLNELYVDLNQNVDAGLDCELPQDWRDVVPLARALVVGDNTAGTIEQVEKLLPASQFRPSVSMVVHRLLSE